jgi:hypothetical protein
MNDTIENKIEKIKPFFEQLTFFFLFLIVFIVLDILNGTPPIAKYTITVLFTGWSISLIIQELYLYNIFKPIILGKTWEKLAKRNLKKK